MENCSDHGPSKGHSDIVDRGTLEESADWQSSLPCANAADRRSPVPELSEVEEMLEQSSIVPEIQRSAGRVGSRGASEKDANESLESSIATAMEEDSSDTMTESQEDALSAAVSVRDGHRRSSFMDGFWACLSPFWKKSREEQNSREEEDGCAFEIPFADIKELDLVGSGSQGTVFCGEYRGEKVAVKKVKDKSYCNEISQLRKLSHPNIVQLR